MHRFSTSLRELYIDWTRTQPDLALADFYALFDTVMQRPADFGFKEEYLKIGCLQARCGKRSREYIWFDDVRCPALSLSSFPRALFPADPCGHT